MAARGDVYGCGWDSSFALHVLVQFRMARINDTGKYAMGHIAEQEGASLYWAGAAKLLDCLDANKTRPNKHSACNANFLQ